ncbi:hypothetical protein [Enterobacter sp. 262D3]|uniref:hypothetical protein n=1 Tax=Enterobacter sp. 262D3 TaxID=3077763 RepID=UPI002A81D90A|nr:hypothetical protein [Enterobacter sp. 262D3]
MVDTTLSDASDYDQTVHAVRLQTFRWPAIRQTRVRMIDFARKPGRQQAVKLNFFEVILRRLCYLLAQKGNPDV